VFHDLRVIGGQQLGALTEVLHRVAAIAHHVPDELVGLGQRRSGPVDELGLHGLPALGVAVAGRGLQRADVEPVTPIGDLTEVLVRVTFAAACPHLALVLRSESLLQVGAATPPGNPIS